MPLAEALVVNILLISVFAIQHSVMARQASSAGGRKSSRRRWKRSTNALLAQSGRSNLLLWQWRPFSAGGLAGSQSENAPPRRSVLEAVGAGSLWCCQRFSGSTTSNCSVCISSPSTHRKAELAPRFRTPLFYKLVRHPIDFAFIIAPWVMPLMTAGYLLFAAVSTAEHLVGIVWKSVSHRFVRRPISRLSPDGLA